jgi:hypothetical protein
MMEGEGYVIGEIERSILNAELFAVRTSRESTGFLQDVERISSPISNGVLEEFSRNDDGDDDEESEPVFESKTERFLFSADVDDDDIEATQMAPMAEKTVSNQTSVMGPPRDRRLSYTRIGDVLKNHMTVPDAFTSCKEKGKMLPPPSRSAQVESSQSKDVFLKRIHQANMEVAEFRSNQSQVEGPRGGTPRRSDRVKVGSSRDTPRYKKTKRSSQSKL